MFKFFTTTQSFAAVTVSAVAAGLVVFLTSGVPVAKAAPQLQLAAQPPQADPAPAVTTASGCSSQAWPNYDQGCLFDLRGSGDEPRIIRVIALQ